MATRLETVGGGNAGLELDQVTAQVFEELRLVPVVATKLGNRNFTFSLLSAFVDDYGQNSKMITSAMITSATIYFPDVPEIRSYGQRRTLSSNEMVYIVAMNPPMEDAEIEGADPAESNDLEKIVNKKKGRKPKKILIGAGELVLARGSLDQLVNSRQLTLDCYHPNSTFSGVEVLRVTGENCLAFSPQAYLIKLLKKQKELDQALAGYGGLKRKSSETNWEEEAKKLKELLRTERLNHRQLSREYAILEEQAVDLRIAKVAARAEKESERGQLLYSLAQDLVAHLIRKGEYSSEGIILCPSIEHIPIRVNFERKLRLGNIDDQPLLVFGADAKSGTDGKTNGNGDTVYPSQSIRYYTHFGTTYGYYFDAERFSKDLPLPALMAKLMEIELRGKKELPNLTPQLLEKRVAGFTSEHIDQALQANLLAMVLSRGSKYFIWTSIQNTLAEIYPYLERYHLDFDKSKP